jgi:hypothetical protein
MISLSDLALLALKIRVRNELYANRSLFFLRFGAVMPPTQICQDASMGERIGLALTKTLGTPAFFYMTLTAPRCSHAERLVRLYSFAIL